MEAETWGQKNGRRKTRISRIGTNWCGLETESFGGKGQKYGGRKMGGGRHEFHELARIGADWRQNHSEEKVRNMGSKKWEEEDTNFTN
jgi:hypothetical protein